MHQTPNTELLLPMAVGRSLPHDSYDRSQILCCYALVLTEERGEDGIGT